MTTIPLSDIGRLDCYCVSAIACISEQDLQHIRLTGHHPLCRKATQPILLDSAISLIAALVEGMTTWAADEDGVHEAVWEAYHKAKHVIDGTVTISEVP